MKKTVLSIAGFDGSCGAGMQADLKTFSAFGCYGLTVLTALPIQNTCGVRKCYALDNQAIADQLECIFDDTIPSSIKIGMLFKKEVIEVVSNFIKKKAKNIPLVLDPVMVATSGDLLLETEAIESLKENLIPLATIITPNLAEARALLGSNVSINNKEEMELTAKELLALGCESVILKGGHLENDTSDDFLLDNKHNSLWLKSKRVTTKNTHGTGCTLSSAIASYLALGFSLKESCEIAKKYLSNAILNAKDSTIGKGNNSVDHFYHMQNPIQTIME